MILRIGKCLRWFHILDEDTVWWIDSWFHWTDCLVIFCGWRSWAKIIVRGETRKSTKEFFWALRIPLLHIGFLIIGNVIDTWKIEINGWAHSTMRRARRGKKGIRNEEKSREKNFQQVISFFHPFFLIFSHNSFIHRNVLCVGCTDPRTLVELFIKAWKSKYKRRRLSQHHIISRNWTSRNAELCIRVSFFSWRTFVVRKTLESQFIKASGPRDWAKCRSLTTKIKAPNR